LFFVCVVLPTPAKKKTIKVHENKSYAPLEVGKSCTSYNSPYAARRASFLNFLDFGSRRSSTHIWQVCAARLRFATAVIAIFYTCQTSRKGKRWPKYSFPFPSAAPLFAVLESDELSIVGYSPLLL